MQTAKTVCTREKFRNSGTPPAGNRGREEPMCGRTGSIRDRERPEGPEENQQKPRKSGPPPRYT